MVRKTIFLTLVFICAYGGGKWNSSLMFGTLGTGVDISYKYRENLAIRGSFNGFNYNDKSREYKSLKFNSSLTLAHIGLLLDTYLFDSNFRFTLGSYYNDSIYQTNAVATEFKEVKILGQSLNTKDFKYINGSVTFNKFNPYIGIGWGNKPKKKAGYGFSFDLGLMYVKPKVRLLPVYNDNIIDTQKEIIYNNDFKLMNKTAEDLISKKLIYNFEPVIRFGINYSY